jgi:hypothetical protein
MSLYISQALSVVGSSLPAAARPWETGPAVAGEVSDANFVVVTDVAGGTGHQPNLAALDLDDQTVTDGQC